MAEQAQVTSVEAVEAFRASLIIFLTKARSVLEETSDDVLRARYSRRIAPPAAGKSFRLRDSAYLFPALDLPRRDNEAQIRVSRARGDERVHHRPVFAGIGAARDKDQVLKSKLIRT